MNLFNLDECNNPPRKERCKSCFFFVTAQHNWSQKKTFYCGDKPCGRTANGFKKIKANNRACYRYANKQEITQEK